MSKPKGARFENKEISFTLTPDEGDLELAILLSTSDQKEREEAGYHIIKAEEDIENSSPNIAADDNLESIAKRLFDPK